MAIEGKVYKARTARPVHQLIRPFAVFASFGASGGILLIVASVIAMVLANSGLYHEYHDILHTELSVSLGQIELKHSLAHWVNDLLMAIFFFAVGLEIKREIIVGELSTFKKASLPIAAALGGMIVPALIYLFFNFSKPTMHGWGVPMATDIAFVLGFLAIFGSRVPTALKVFLAALAIVDDIGAVLVIAFFYTESIAMIPLFLAGISLLIMLLGNWIGIRNPWFYLFVGGALWLAFLKSGIHATLSGVLAAMCIPARSLINKKDFISESQSLISYFSKNGDEESDKSHFSTPNQEAAVHTLEQACEHVQTPLTRIEHQVLPWVTFLIMPLFAFANAGVHMESSLTEALSEASSLGIGAGLILGKPIGITLFSWLAIKFKLAEFPRGVNWLNVVGASILAGIGFTMSIFIANLAFSSEILGDAKVAILTFSSIAAIAGMSVLWYSFKKQEKTS